MGGVIKNKGGKMKRLTFESKGYPTVDSRYGDKGNTRINLFNYEYPLQASQRIKVNTCRGLSGRVVVCW